MTEPLLTDRFDEALRWASELHRDQLRKGKQVPYVAHLLGVASLVLEAGGTEDQAIGALLHDSIEDQGVTDDDLIARFGPGVATIVRACTDADTDPKPPWGERKRAYLAHLATAPAEAVLVSLADKVHNARDIAADVAADGDGVLDRFTGGPDGTRWYYRRLHQAFSARTDVSGTATLLDHLAVAIAGFGATPAAASDYETRP